jgi:hypothetical protein
VLAQLVLNLGREEDVDRQRHRLPLVAAVAAVADAVVDPGQKKITSQKAPGF